MPLEPARNVISYPPFGTASGVFERGKKRRRRLATKGEFDALTR
jgi:hypothetical protein